MKTAEAVKDEIISLLDKLDLNSYVKARGLLDEFEQLVSKKSTSDGIFLMSIVTEQFKSANSEVFNASA